MNLATWNQSSVERKVFLPQWSWCPVALVADLEDPDSIRARNRRREREREGGMEEREAGREDGWG